MYLYFDKCEIRLKNNLKHRRFFSKDNNTNKKFIKNRNEVIIKNQ
jgi:hypothetical protein